MDEGNGQAEQGKKGRREGLFGRMRKRRLRRITVLPSLVTMLNGLFGFAAISFASRGEMSTRLGLPYFAAAGYMILLAMIADMLDGRLARMSQNTSSFGGQLDSLCDAISFGAAPAFLMMKLVGPTVEEFAEYNVALGNLLERGLWLAAGAYLTCAVIRLARFNVENEEDESAHMSFVGLPTPAAAGVIVSLVIFHEHGLRELAVTTEGTYWFLTRAIVWVLPFVSVGIAALMVSRIRYPHVLNQYLRGRKPFALLIRIMLTIGLIYLVSLQAAMVLIFCGFAGSGFTRWFYHRVLRRHAGADEEPVVAQQH